MAAKKKTRGNKKQSSSKSKREKIATTIDASIKTCYLSREHYGGGRRQCIPTDKNGNVEEETLLARLFSRSGDRRNRNPGADIRKENRKVQTLKSRKAADIADWWDDPGLFDLEGIDTPDRKVFEPYGLENASKAMVKAQRKVAIIGTPAQARKIRSTLNDNFSAAEISRMTKNGEVVVTVGFTGASNRTGYYRSKQPNVLVEDICLIPSADEDTITHEFIHLSRDRDKTRSGYAKTPYPKDSEGYRVRTLEQERLKHSCAEESATVAETIARTRKLSENTSGYYLDVPGISTSNEARGAYIHDRKVLAKNEKGQLTGRKGSSAIAAVNKKYGDTKISGMTVKNSKKTAKQYYDDK